jgi:TolA-binding protein
MSKNAELKTAMSDAFIDLQVKCNAANALDKIQLRKELDKMSAEIAKLNVALLKESTVVNDADMQEMAEIKQLIDKAASKQQLIASIAKAIGFIASKVI